MKVDVQKSLVNCSFFKIWPSLKNVFSLKTNQNRLKKEFPFLEDWKIVTANESNFAPNKVNLYWFDLFAHMSHLPFFTTGLEDAVKFE